jgi:hypothetical protein
MLIGLLTAEDAIASIKCCGTAIFVHNGLQHGIYNHIDKFERELERLQREDQRQSPGEGLATIPAVDGKNG